MAEISVQFKNKINGYDKVEVQEYAKGMEARLQEKSMALANAEQKIEELEARLNKIIGTDSSIEEKVELYDKLMKKMNRTAGAIGFAVYLDRLSAYSEGWDVDTLLLTGDAGPAEILTAAETLPGTVLAAKTEPADRTWKRKAILEDGEVRYLD